MADLRKVLVTWNGATGLPGLSVFYTLAADDVTTNLGTFFTAIKALFPAGMTWSIPSAGDQVSDNSGQLTGGWVGGTAATVTATGGGSYAAGTGTFVQWGTSIIVNNRRLKGRTFLAPLSSTQYDTDGTISAAPVTTMNTALSTLVGVSKLRVFHRPPVHTFSGGTSSVITSGVCADKATSLRTRRT
jgi:hypothetical protein